jgi:hypothetical protein
MSTTPDVAPTIQPAVMLAVDYLALVARASPAYRGPLPTKRTGKNNITLYKARPGATVEVWFRRITPSKFPEVRVGVVFASNFADVNAECAKQFESRFAEELKQLGCAPWPSDTNCDRRFTTPVAVPMPGADLGAFATRVAELGARYAELLKTAEGIEPQMGHGSGTD